MIQIYAPDNVDFDMNGNEVLFPETCDMEAELGGAWVLEMTHPIDDEGRWKNIVNEAVIAVPTFMGKKQLFRIDDTDKQDTEITVKAYPIFYDSADEAFLMDKRPTGKNGQETLDILLAGTKYSGESDIPKRNTAYFIRRNFMDCLNGESPSFVNIWGGEPLYDNNKVIVNKRAGGDYGAEVRYGKNMAGISVKEDMSEVVTRIIPVAFNGRTLSTDWVDSPLIKKYAKIYAKEIVFEDVKLYEDVEETEDTSNIIVCNTQEELDAALVAKCKEQFEAGIDIYKVTITVDMVSLENTEEYKDFADIVKIGLGDTVKCYNKRLGITASARAIKIKWDCITNSVKEVTLGDYEYDFLKQWNSTAQKIEAVLNKDGSVMAEKVQGILDGIQTQLKIQSTAAKKVNGRVFYIEDTDEQSDLYGCMVFGTQGLQIAYQKNANGEWDWTTAVTARGILADAIITGLLSDKNGKNWWNLDTGEFCITEGVLRINGSVTKYASDYSEEDYDILNNKLLGIEETTIEDLERYDFDGDGNLTTLDLITLRKLVEGEIESKTLNTSVEINPLESQNIIKTHGVAIGIKGIKAHSLKANETYSNVYYTYDSESQKFASGTTGTFNTNDGSTVHVVNGLITRII